jgi:dephospho-CoA kinase
MIDYPNIALIGKAGSGKDTVARSLRYEFPQLGYERFALADKVKEVAALLWPDASRARWQELGEAMRILDRDVWLAAMLREVTHAQTFSGVRRVVVTDVRYRNEFMRFKELGYVTVRVNCDTATRIDRLRRTGKLGLLEELEHTSETELDNMACDYEVENHAYTTPAGLTKQLAQILDSEAK